MNASPSNKARLQSFRILLTGGSGLLGTRLLALLHEEGAEVLSVERAALGDWTASWNSLQDDWVRTQSVHRPHSALLHLAGISDLAECRRNPLETFRVNTGATFRALEFASTQGFEQFVFASSGRLYGDQLTRPAVEADPSFATTAYLASKLSGEAWVESFAQDYGISGTSVRLGNVYGSRSGTGTLVGNLLQQLHSQGRAELLDFSPVRDFIHVHDVAEGLIQLLLARSEKKGHLRVNLSSGKGYSVGGVAKAALKVFALSPQAITERQSPSHSQQIGLPSSLVLDNSLLRRITGWSPVFDLESGLRQAMNERSGQN